MEEVMKVHISKGIVITRITKTRYAHFFFIKKGKDKGNRKRELKKN